MAQIGEGRQSQTYNQNGVGGKTTITYYATGYYEGYKLNVKDIVDFTHSGGTSYYATGTAYWIDGVSVTHDGGSKPGNYYKVVDKDFTLRIRTRERRTNKSSTTDCDVTLNIKCIPVTFTPPSEVCSNGSSIYLKNHTNNYNGSFSGTGVSGNYFYPSSAGAGYKTITYTLYEKSHTATIRVVDPETNDLYIKSEGYYNTDGELDLNTLPTTTGGTWSAKVGTTPLALRSGRYLDLYNVIPDNDYSTTTKNVTLSYTFSNGPCTRTITKTLPVHNNNIYIEFNDLPNMCADGSELDLSSYVSPNTGTFKATGLAIYGGSFLQASKTGVFQVDYTVEQNGAEKTVTKYVRVNDLPEVDFDYLPDLCVASNVNLNNYVTPTGGTFEGRGVTGNMFNPVTAGIGTHNVTYTFTDANGCSITESREIEVVELLPTTVAWSAIANVCEDATTIYLPDYINHTGGTFSGKGVTGDYFNPVTAGSGSHLIKYSVKTGTCKQEYTTTITVLANPAITFNALPSVCYTGSEISLSAYVSVPGGTFSGTGVVSNKFYGDIAGIGVHNIYYNYTDANGCSISTQQTIEVEGQIPGDLNFSSIAATCEQGTIIDLSNYVNYSGGTFSGKGVTGSSFDPVAAGPGVHKVTYRYFSGSCTESKEQTINVQPATVVSFYDIPTVCYKTPINLTGYISHTGGTFTGKGVTGNFFYPENAGIGQHVVTYRYVNSLGCETIVTKTIEIDLLVDETVAFSSIADKCINSPSVYLRSFINTSEGEFRGPGVTGDYFNPGDAGVGTWTVTWSQTNGGCNQEITTTITVGDEPAVLFNALPTVCYAGETITLESYVSHTGGTFNGPGVVNGIFNADQAGEGTHTLSYVYQQGDCEVTKTQTVFVKGLLPQNAVFNALPNLCVSGSVIDLKAYVNIQGGTFNGIGVTGTLFDPAVAGTGVVEITYTLTAGGCDQELKQTLTVENITSVDFYDLGIICDSQTKNLNGYVSHTGGTFTGPGVTGSIFDPTTAGVGAHTLTYTYTNSSGCETIVNKTVNVDLLLPSISWSSLPDVCQNSSAIYLPDYINHSGGSFSGVGVSGSYFNPSVAGTGIFTIKYTATGGRCSQEYTTSIQVSEGTNVTFSTIPSICFNEPVDLNSYVSHTGGTFSGVGVSGNVFDPSIAGRGTYTITYSYNNVLGCETSLTQSVSVIDLLENVNFTALPTVCESSTPIILDSYITNHTTGIFSGPGVVGNVFDPSNAGEGIHQLKYTINNGGCFIELKQNVTVHPKVDVTFAPQSDVCYNQSFDIAYKVSPSGGTFSGNGISGTTFDPATAGVGSHIITYTYTSVNGCETSATQTFKVVDLIDVNIAFDPMPEVCTEAGTVYLPDFMNHTGGAFSGKGVNGNYFNPAIAGTGTHLITYTVTAGSCVISVTDVIDVFEADQIVFSSVPNQCYDAPVNLADYVSPQGGTFSGSGVLDNKFYPGNVGFGSYTITYEYTNGKGCKGTATKVIEVVDLMSSDISFSSLPEVCQESSVINLRNYVNSVEGEFKGKGITGDYFDPAAAGAGVHKLLFQIINGTCKIERYQSIIVKSPPELLFTDLPDVCNPGLIDLSSFVLPKGGTFSGNGVGGNFLDPTVAGIGDHTISYMLTDANGCTNTITKTISIVDVIPSSITFNVLPDICTNSTSLKISDYITNYQSNGEFSGPGVSGEYFNPSQAGEGTHLVEYTVGNGSCEIVAQQYIEVKGIDSNILFHTLPLVCQSTPINLRDYTSKDGSFSGPGVSSGVFNPATAGVGTHTITFAVLNDLGCEYVLTQEIEVLDLLPTDVTFAPLPDRCQSGSAIKLSDYTNISGTFSGTGVDGDYFNPSTVSPGTYTLRFTFSSGKCESSIRQTVTVLGEEEIYINPMPSVCNKNIVYLDQYVTVSGGVWSGAGVSNNKFYPENAGVGTHVVTYTYTNALNCKTILQETIKVNELLPGGITFNVIDDACEDSSPIDLYDYISVPVTGKFTGTGVEGNYFSPSISGPGAFVIYFEVGSSTSCKQQYSQTVVVHTKEAIVFSPIPEKCDNNVIDLTNYVSHKGGNFSGIGVNGTEFDPSMAGQGDHLITYNYENLAGCKTVVTQTISVPRIYPTISFNPLSEVCENSGTVNLLESVNYAGGVFSGTGVSGNVFNPSLAGPGSHLITYTVGTEVCKVITEQTITVVGVPEITIATLPDVCLDKKISLIDYVNVQGGTFSGAGVVNNVFDPSVAGLGEHVINFSYSSNGCFKQVSSTITVLSTINPNITFSPISSMCVDAQAVDLGLYSNVEANFSGNGVTGNLFYPSVAGAGIHEITMTVGNGTCSTEFRQYVTVNGKTELIIEPIPEICNGESINLNNYVNITGGVFEGDNVSANYFYPSSTGDYIITYTYTNRNGCVNSAKFTVTVNGMYPDVITFTQVPNLCPGASIIDLRHYTSYFGDETTFSGPGIVGYLFDPAVAGVGIHQISMTNGSGTCETVSTQLITINDNTSITFDLPSTLCKDELIDLSALVDVQGGIFSGNGVVSNTLRTTSAGIGTHVINYEYTNDYGCETVISKTVNITALNPSDVVFENLPDLCENHEAINLKEFVNESSNITFIGNGVTGYMFYPEEAGPGTHVITLRVGLTSGCVDEYKQNINVLALPTLEFSPLPEVCFEGDINLLDYVNDRSGYFEGPGVTGSIFNPSLAGTGVHTITYFLLDDFGCYSVATNTVEVKTLYPTSITFSSLPTMCVEDEGIFLTDYVDFNIGEFSGPGVSNSMFNPSVAGAGTHAITYTVGLGECATVKTQYVTVFPKTIITFAPLPEICEEVVIDLKQYVNRQGGIFEGDVVIDDTIRTAGLMPGEYSIVYNYYDANGCTNSSTQILKVNGTLPKDIAFTELPTLCESGDILYLTDYVDNKTGNFTGEGVKNSIFNPSEAGAGTHRITYTLSNGVCENEYYQYLTVVPSQSVTFVTLPEVCSDMTIQLDSYVTPTGGTFEGVNVVDNTINTAGMAAGNYEITYTYQDGNGCVITAKQVLKVNGHLPQDVTFTELPTLCENSGAIYLTDYVNNLTGNFTGEGVRNSLFDPAESGAGTHRITYTIENGTCSAEYTQSITVVPTQNVTFVTLPEVCSDMTIQLDSYVTPIGGTFEGVNVVDNTINTADMAPDNYEITYTYQDGNGCVVTAKQVLKVNGHLPQDVTFTELPTLCESGEAIYLTDYVNNLTGNFKGEGVRNSLFDPAESGAGTHRITYTIEDGVCRADYTQFITVVPSQSVTFAVLPEVCSDMTIQLDSYVTPKGGTFEGVNVVGNTINTADMAPDNYEITYTYQDGNGCVITAKQVLKVNGHLPQDVTFTELPTLCENGEAIYLTDYVNNLTGNFTGEGVRNSLFDPVAAGAGTHRITYTIEDGTCSDRHVQYITVYPKRNVVFNVLPEICESQKLDLSPYVTVEGGTFSGQAVSGTFVDTELLPIGDHVITYTYTDNNGCTTEVSATLTVSGHNPPEGTIVFTPFAPICVNSTTLDLTETINHSGGEFSGNGVTGTVFDPAAAGFGIHLISYTYGDGNCSLTVTESIEVKDAPQLVFHDIPDMCYITDEVNLANYVSVQGGSFSGSGIEGSVLKRSLLDVGIYTITYNYNTSNGCTITLSKTITIEEALPETATFSQPSDICVNGGKVNLFQFVSTNGTFSGTGVEADGLFNPATAGVGEHRIEFTYGNGSCAVQIHQFINVTDSKNVTFAPLGKVCNTTPVELSEYVNYKGGIFEGRGVVDGIFYPENVGEGIYLVTYTLNDGLCTVVASQNIEVLSTRTIQVNIDRSVVESSALVKFSTEGVDLVDYNWTFGDGGYSLEAEPFHYYYHEGTFDVTLECTDINGCQHYVSKEDFVTVSAYVSGMKSVISVNDPSAKVGVHYEDALDMNQEKSMKVYPNPFKEQFNIALEGYTGTIEINILNLTGQTIEQLTVNNPEGEAINVDMSGYKPGIYFVQLDRDVIKIVKQ